MEGRKPTGDPLKDVQNVLFKMLIHLDQICKNNNIQYWLDSGSLLGSIRHQGFIPWDDDLDIGMLRKDYNKFKRVILDSLADEYSIETYELNITGKHNYIKIMYLNDFEWLDGNGNMHKGISIDIFPFDYVKGTNCISFPAKIFNRLSRVLHRKNAANLKESVAIFMNRAQLQNIYCPFNNATSTITYGIETPWFGDAFFDIKDLLPLKTGKFEGYQFPIPNNADQYLRNLYGDYMIIPNEEQRQIHLENLQYLN